MRHFRITSIAIIALALVFLMQYQSYAQNSVSNYKEELSQNIMELDAIEGLYDVSFKIDAYAPIAGLDTKTYNYTAVIRSYPDEEGIFIFMAWKMSQKDLKERYKKEEAMGIIRFQEDWPMEVRIQAKYN